MPTYVYKCRKCGKVFELRQPFRAPKPEACPEDGCGGEVTKLLTPPAIVFKGPGFHVNDYGPSGAKDKGPSRSSPGKPSAEKLAAAVTED